MNILIKSIAIIICLIFMTACAKSPEIVHESNTITLQSIKQENVQEPLLQGNTNNDLANYALNLQHALKLCNAKLSVTSDR